MKKVFHFYAGNYRLELRKVKFAQKYNRKFLFIKYFKSKPSKICMSCRQVRLQYRNCGIGLDQWNKKSCRYQSFYPRLTATEVVMKDKEHIDN